MFVFFVCLLLCGFIGLSSQQQNATQENVSGLNSTLANESDQEKKCVLPNPPLNGRYTWFSVSYKCLGRNSVGEKCWPSKGWTFSNNLVISIFCNPGYQLQGYSSEYFYIACKNGQWTDNFPTCESPSVPGTCRRLVSLSLDIKCIFAGQEIPCNSNLPAGTVATIKCRQHFTLSAKPSYSTLLCQDNGEWNHPLYECNPPECGVPLPPAAVSHVAWRGYPWTAFLVIDRGDTSVNAIGTLISNKVVLTAPAPLYNKPFRKVVVYLGLSDNAFEEFQVHKVVYHSKYIHTEEDPKAYNGVSLLILERRVKLSARIMPACVDWTNTHTPTMGINITGYTVGRNSSDILLRYQLKYNDAASSPGLLDAYNWGIHDDMFCVFNFHKFNLCNGSNCYEWDGPRDGHDFGSGLTFVDNGKHYVAGMMTLWVRKVKAELYTNITYPENMNWIRKEIDDTSTECAVPNSNGNTLFKKYNCQNNCEMTSEDWVYQGDLMVVSCSPGYSLVHGVNTIVASVLISCESGRWLPEIPLCYKLCPPLISATVDFECFQGPFPVNCNKLMLPETQVKYACKQYHDGIGRFDTNRMKCTSEGVWSRQVPHCTPKCGISNLNTNDLQTQILGGSYAKPGNVPWHAALYIRVENNWENKCGGTLVSTRHVLTAAHCVTLDSAIGRPPSRATADVMAGLGKYYRQKDSTEGINIEIQQILIHPKYYGKSLNYPNDIAVLVLQSEVQVDRSIMPACLDLRFSHMTVEKTHPGNVAGWGNTEDCSSFGDVCDTPSNELKLTQTRVIDFDKCFNITQTIKPAFASRLTFDKFCTGNKSVSVIQQGDSGGGLTFDFGGLNYVYGVVSVKLKWEQQDKVYYNFGAFTNVSYHLDWLNTIL